MNEAKPQSLGDIFREYHYCQNPVTKAVLRQIISDRLDKLENVLRNEK